MGQIIFAAVDVETTGLDVERHEMIDFAVVPLDENFIFSDIPEFDIRIKAEHAGDAELQAMQVNQLNPSEGVSRDAAAQEFRQWLIDNGIEKIVPVAHNLEFDMKFICRTFPVESKVFSHHGRDSMRLALAVNDIFRRETGEVLFPSASLRTVRDVLGIPGEQTHHALDDAKDAAVIYRRMLKKLTQN